MSHDPDEHTLDEAWGEDPAADDQARGIVHACPRGDSGYTPCCNETPFLLPRTDRMTLDPALVTCHGSQP